MNWNPFSSFADAVANVAGAVKAKWELTMDKWYQARIDKDEAAKAAKAVKPAAAAAPAGLAAKVASLVALNEAVRKAESELEKLYVKHDALMVSIKGWI